MDWSGRTPVTLTEEKRDLPEISRTVRRHAYHLHLGSDFGPSETMRGTDRSRPTIRRWWSRFPERASTGFPPMPRVRRAGRRYPPTGPLTGMTMPHTSHRALVGPGDAQRASGRVQQKTRQKGQTDRVAIIAVMRKPESLRTHDTGFRTERSPVDKSVVDLWITCGRTREAPRIVPKKSLDTKYGFSLFQCRI